MNIIKEKKINLIFLFVASVLMWYVSQCSFRYSVNESVDSNMFIEGGRLLLAGKKAYLDFLDYKGILVYLIHALSLLIFPKSFHGIYFLEILAAYCFYLYAYKTIKILKPEVNEIYLSIVVVLGASLGYLSSSMTNGDQVEEFTLPLAAYFIYQIVRYIKEEVLDKKGFIIVGVHIGILFWSKFLCLIPHFLLFVSFLIYLIAKKKTVEIIKLITNMFLGFCFITIPLLIYFIVTKSFLVMCEIYFFENIFAYGKDRGPDLSNLGFFLRFFFQNLVLMPSFFGCLISALFCKKRENIMVYLAIIHIATIISITLCKAWLYYYMPVFLFIPYELFYLIELFKIKEIKIFLFNFVLLSMVVSYFWHMNLHYPNKTNSKQQRFAEIINQTENPKVLNCAYETGFLLVADVLPMDYFYAIICRHTQTIYDRYSEIIENNDCDYVIVGMNGTEDHNIDWTDTWNNKLESYLTKSGYEMIYSCDDVGRDDYTNPYSIMTLYKLKTK